MKQFRNHLFLVACLGMSMGLYGMDFDPMEGLWLRHCRYHTDGVPRSCTYCPSIHEYEQNLKAYLQHIQTAQTFLFVDMIRKQAICQQAKLDIENVPPGTEQNPWNHARLEQIHDIFIDCMNNLKHTEPSAAEHSDQQHNQSPHEEQS